MFKLVDMPAPSSLEAKTGQTGQGNSAQTPRRALLGFRDRSVNTSEQANDGSDK